MQNNENFTTPFGNRPVSPGQLAGQIYVRELPEGKSADKWKLFRDICASRCRLGLPDRALIVLNALLSFHPAQSLDASDGLVVYPSNAKLSLRAHGMAASTLRRHLSCLVEAGLIVRKDSANGKRFARKNPANHEVFGFSIAPLLTRAAEFAYLAAEVEAERIRARCLREQLTILRRDIVKLLEFGEETAPYAGWQAFRPRYSAALAGLTRVAGSAELAAVIDSLRPLRTEISNALEILMNREIVSAKESHSERHNQDSKTESRLEFELSIEGKKAAQTARPPAGADPDPKSGEKAGEAAQLPRTSDQGVWNAFGGIPVSPSLVAKACPDICDYAPGGVSSWKDLMAAAVVVRSMLGISPSAYEEACSTFGQEGAATMIACILQRYRDIKSPGGYVRGLTGKARAGKFSLWPMLISQLRSIGHGI